MSWTNATPSGRPYGGQTSKGSAFVALPMTLESGEELWWRGYPTPAAIERTKRQLAALGWAGEKVEDWQPLEKAFRVVVEEDEWEGQTRRKIAMIADSKPKTPRANDAVNALLGASAAPAKPQPTAAPVDTDDIPF